MSHARETLVLDELQGQLERVLRIEPYAAPGLGVAAAACQPQPRRLRLRSATHSLALVPILAQVAAPTTRRVLTVALRRVASLAAGNIARKKRAKEKLISRSNRKAALHVPLEVLREHYADLGITVYRYTFLDALSVLASSGDS